MSRETPWKGWHPHLEERICSDEQFKRFQDKRLRGVQTLWAQTLEEAPLLCCSPAQRGQQKREEGRCEAEDAKGGPDATSSKWPNGESVVFSAPRRLILLV